MKETVATFTAVIMILSGIALSVASFLTVPTGDISESVLWYLAQALVYAGSIFGVKIYIDNRFNNTGHKPTV